MIDVRLIFNHVFQMSHANKMGSHANKMGSHANKKKETQRELISQNKVRKEQQAH